MSSDGAAAAARPPFGAATEDSKSPLVVASVPATLAALGRDLALGTEKTPLCAREFFVECDGNGFAVINGTTTTTTCADAGYVDCINGKVTVDSKEETCKDECDGACCGGTSACK